jgi:hypothetical protein
MYSEMERIGEEAAMTHFKFESQHLYRYECVNKFGDSVLDGIQTR